MERGKPRLICKVLVHRREQVGVDNAALDVLAEVIRVVLSRFNLQPGCDEGGRKKGQRQPQHMSVGARICLEIGDLV